MSKAIFLLFSLLLLAAPAARADNAFHAPKTEAEKALNKILNLNNTDKDISSFIWKNPDRDTSKDKIYTMLFTSPLQKAWEKAYLSIPEEPEGGRYVGFSFISCGQGDAGILFYATVQKTKDVAYIAVTDSQGIKASPKETPFPYRMLKENGKWKLDGVKCFSNSTLNTDFHYTR